MEKQLQQQLAQMSNMQKQQTQAQQSHAGNAETVKQLQKMEQDLKAATTERDRFQNQLELLVQELEKHQVCRRL
jgi:hypothetical protein